MVALQQPYPGHGEPSTNSPSSSSLTSSSKVEQARAEVERLQTGLPRALLATVPDVLRSVAARAALAEERTARWDARVGERPDLVPEAEAAADAARSRFDASRTEREQVVDHSGRTLVRGNLLALGAFGFAGCVLFLGGSPMDLPVAVSVVAAPLAPLTAGWLATSRASTAARAERAARQQWAEALEVAGVPTVGALAARRLAIRAWETRKAEAAVVAEKARPDLRAWQLIAGPGVPAAEVEDVLDRVERLRRAQLALLGALLDERVEGLAMNVLSPAGEVAEPDAAPGWLADALVRFRSSTMRLWTGGQS